MRGVPATHAAEKCEKCSKSCVMSANKEWATRICASRLIIEECHVLPHRPGVLAYAVKALIWIYAFIMNS